LNDEIENNKTLTKESGKEIKNQNNKDQIASNNTWQIVTKGRNWKHQKLSQKDQGLK